MLCSRIAGLCALTVSFVLPTNAADGPRAKNIIVMVADGWGFNHIEATDYYQYGEQGKQVYQRKFTLYPMSTYSVSGDGYDPAKAWTDYEYLKKGAADSAATATTMSSGVKTLNGAIGMGPDGKPLEHAIEVAERAGKATGVVTSVQWSHATPAAFVAHDKSRGQYEIIAQQMIRESACEVIMGAGNPDYDNEGQPIKRKHVKKADDAKPDNSFRFVGGEKLWRELKAGKAGGDCDGDGKADYWKLVQSKDDVAKLMTGRTPKRVLATVEAAETLQASRKGVDDTREDDMPFQTPLLANVPTLQEMALAAINVLDDDPDGFYLMIEGGAVDWACHANAAGRMIEEMIDYNKAVEAVVQWVEQHSSWEETLVVVTGDHECGFVLGPGSKPELKPIVNNGKGNMPGFEFHHKSHTNQLIPCFVKGAGSELFAEAAKQEDPKRGKYIDNTDIGMITKRLMGAGGP
ncbi:MAG: alkaline phosphatase [Candidatus Hydrogenedentes bacterium]|nr:alkaline phosphatase [Candidatus Hydrogenedentota bacterium]